MIYEMHLKKRYFDLILRGSKKIEGRIVKPSRRGMKRGDEIIFIEEETGRRMRCIVKRVSFYETIESMVATEGYKNLIKDTQDEEEVIEIYRGFYGDSKGFMAIELERCELIRFLYF